jgi:hypothetical protein
MGDMYVFLIIYEYSEYDPNHIIYYANEHYDIVHTSAFFIIPQGAIAFSTSLEYIKYTYAEMIRMIAYTTRTGIKYDWGGEELKKAPYPIIKIKE